MFRSHNRNLLAGVAVVVGTMAAPAQAAPNCEGRAATIVGDAEDNRIFGTDRSDVIVAKGGDDTVEGLGGRDRICGGSGRDLLRGNEGDDLLNTGASVSTADSVEELFGGSGDDVFDATSATRYTRTWAGSGDDEYQGWEGIDYFVGGADDDRVFTYGGPDTLYGGSGDDFLISGNSGQDIVDGGDGSDYCEGNIVSSCP